MKRAYTIRMSARHSTEHATLTHLWSQAFSAAFSALFGHISAVEETRQKAAGAGSGDFCFARLWSSKQGLANVLELSQQFGGEKILYNLQLFKFSTAAESFLLRKPSTANDGLQLWKRIYLVHIIFLGHFGADILQAELLDLLVNWDGIPGTDSWILLTKTYLLVGYFLPFLTATKIERSAVVWGNLYTTGRRIVGTILSSFPRHSPAIVRHIILWRKSFILYSSRRNWKIYVLIIYIIYNYIYIRNMCMDRSLSCLD